MWPGLYLSNMNNHIFIHSVVILSLGANADRIKYPISCHSVSCLKMSDLSKCKLFRSLLLYDSTNVYSEVSHETLFITLLEHGPIG